MLHTFDMVLAAIRPAFLVLAAVFAAVCAADWLVRTRRLRPFGPVARFMRATVDPLIRPVERRVVRAGGLPASAPMWALATVVLSGIALISLLEFLRTQSAFLALALEGGPGGVYRMVVSWTTAALQIALLVRVVSSWIGVSPYAWYVRWSYRMSEPVLAPLRRVIPAIGMVDITPIVAWFALGLLRTLLLSLA